MRMKSLTLTQTQTAQIIAHARSEAPLEACGLLGGQDGRVRRIYPAANVLHSPTRYEIDPHVLIAALRDMASQGWGPDPLAIYHSHPKGPETPSQTDIALASYPDSVYLIIAHLDSNLRAAPSLRGFYIIAGQVQKVSLRILRDRTENSCAA
jgi:[CysO sulfur-carrier protein]-S-L-cysteine hydrolase